jgi:hypothetical protein
MAKQYGYWSGQTIEMNDVGIAKFAELIIKECAEALDKNIAPPSHPLNSIGYKLKEHFGVV